MMTPHHFSLRIAASLAFAFVPTAALAAPPLKPHAPIAVPGGPGGFDWMLVDRTQNRLYASHGGTKTLTVLNLKSGLIREVNAGDVAGVTVDARDNKVFTGGGDQKIVVLSNTTLAKIGEISVTGPVDDIKYDPKNGMVYAAHDDGTEDWVINAATDKLVGTVTIPGAPEAFAYDASTGLLYQNIKPSDCIDVINPATNKVIATWPTLPARSPHGLVIDPLTHWLFSAGGNGKLTVYNVKTKKLIAAVDIAPGTDQIGFDPKTRRIYCASRGFVSVVQETATGAKSLGNVPSPKGAHTLAVDPATGDVWVCYSNSKGSYLQKFSVNR